MCVNAYISNDCENNKASVIASQSSKEIINIINKDCIQIRLWQRPNPEINTSTSRRDNYAIEQYFSFKSTATI